MQWIEWRHHGCTGVPYMQDTFVLKEPINATKIDELQDDFSGDEDVPGEVHCPDCSELLKLNDVACGGSDIPGEARIVVRFS